MRTNGGACSCIRLFQAVTLCGNFGPAPGRAARVGLADTASERRWSPLTPLKFMKLGGFRLRFSRLRGGRRMAAAATTPHLMSHIHKHLVLAYLHGYLPFLNYGCRYFVLKDKARHQAKVQRFEANGSDPPDVFLSDLGLETTAGKGLNKSCMLKWIWHVVYAECWLG